MKKNLIKFLQLIKEHLIPIIIVLVIIIALVIYGLIHCYKPYKVDKDYSKLNLDKVDRLMIVAHPDDEMLWGGAHLIDGNYLVVCVTCGVVKERVNEFKSVMAATGSEYIMLGYPDKTNGQRDSWDDWREKIAKDIDDIINLKDWKSITTHNPDGEYGHQHHKMTSKIVTDVLDDKDKLYYFGIYHSKKTITPYLDSMTPIRDGLLEEKKKILGLYASQSFIQTSFDHMFGYEDWIQYKDWEVTE